MILLQRVPTTVQLSLVYNGFVSLLLNEQTVHLKIPTANLRAGMSLTIPCLSEPVFIQDISSQEVKDDLQNYLFQFMQWYFVDV